MTCYGALMRISPAEAHAKMTDEGYVYVDVRTEEEFAEGHPQGAYNVPFAISKPAGMEPNPEFVAVMEKAFGKDKPIILGCKSGNRSARAAQALANAGFTRVLDQRAGWDGARGPFGEIAEPGWSRTNLPRETETQPGHSYRELKG